MRAPAIPKMMLIHEMQYKEYMGKDDYGNDSFKPPLAIKHVRVDESTVFSRDNTQSKVLANAVIFIDKVHSSPLPTEFKEQSKIVFNGREMVLQKVIPVYQPFGNEVRHWELEVM